MRNEFRRPSLFPGSNVTPEMVAGSPQTAAAKQPGRRLPWFRVIIIAICVIILRGLRYATEEPHPGVQHEEHNGHHVSTYGEMFSSFFVHHNASTTTAPQPPLPPQRSATTLNLTVHNATLPPLPLPRKPLAPVDKAGGAAMNN
eukprot:TRINITY_DN3376_c0_g3_i1.p1 TRINITY_DN3376_c0_g3~~TRINITY_DN3376_c0_g3_i1.p1  ORF type:complete len:144 (+),score=7.88 TRINITY_DN3376_c0_g3_i1:74-505(+)